MMDDVHPTYQVFERGHSMMQIPLGVASPRLGTLSDEAVAEALHSNYGSMFGERGEGPIQLANRSAREYAVSRVRQRCIDSGVDISDLRDDQVIDDFHVLAFPNLIFNTHSEMHTLFRARPGVIPGKSSVDFYLFHRLPSADGNGFGAGHAKGPLDHVDYPEGSRITEVLDQDLDGIARVHAGLLSAGSPRSASPISNAVSRRCTLNSIITCSRSRAPVAQSNQERARAPSERRTRQFAVSVHSVIPSTRNSHERVRDRLRPGGRGR